MILRDYMYLDTGRLQDYLSSLDPGVIEEFTETTRSQTGREGTGGIKAYVVEARGGGSSEEETTRQQTIRVRTQNMFSRIYDELNKDASIKIFDEENPISLDRVRKREVVEITGTFSPSPLNDMIDSILHLMELMEGMGFTEQTQDPKTQQAVRALAMIFRGDEGKEEVPMVSKPEGTDVSCLFLAKSKYIMVETDDFVGEMTVFGKVQKLVPAGQSIDLFDFLKLPRAMRSGVDLKEKLFDMFESWPTELGGPVARESTQVAGPAIVVTPVAVYEA